MTIQFGFQTHFTAPKGADYFILQRRVQRIQEHLTKSPEFDSLHQEHPHVTVEGTARPGDTWLFEVGNHDTTLYSEVDVNQMLAPEGDEYRQKFASWLGKACSALEEAAGWTVIVEDFPDFLQGKFAR